MADEMSSGGNVSNDDKLMGALAYLGILVLIPLLMKKDSAFVQFHAKQGLVLFIAEVILSWIPFVGWFFLAPILGIVALIALIMAVSGKEWKIPLIWSIAEKIKL